MKKEVVVRKIGILEVTGRVQPRRELRQDQSEFATHIQTLQKAVESSDNWAAGNRLLTGRGTAIECAVRELGASLDNIIVLAQIEALSATIEERAQYLELVMQFVGSYQITLDDYPQLKGKIEWLVPFFQSEVQPKTEAE